MKLKITINGKTHWIEPSQKWQNYISEEPIDWVKVDSDFYVASFLVSESFADSQVFPK